MGDGIRTDSAQHVAYEQTEIGIHGIPRAGQQKMEVDPVQTLDSVQARLEYLRGLPRSAVTLPQQASESESHVQAFPESVSGWRSEHFEVVDSDSEADMDFVLIE